MACRRDGAKPLSEPMLEQLSIQHYSAVVTDGLSSTSSHSAVYAPSCFWAKLFVVSVSPVAPFTNMV